MEKWLLLAYRIPREPTAGRVYVWRKLKKLGAIPVQDAVWVLPETRRTREQFQWLASEISELDGEAILWNAEQLYATDPGTLRNQFIAPIETEYQSILAALRKKNADLAGLSKRFQDVRARDYFSRELGRQVQKKLIASSKGKLR